MDHQLTETSWARTAPLLTDRQGTKGERGQDNRRFVEAVLWLARVLAAVQQDDALHTLLVDSTTVWANQHASGARKKTGRNFWAAAAVGSPPGST